jgi:hypothetical protein
VTWAIGLGLRACDTFVDDIGVGRGVTDRLREKGIMVVAVNVGAGAMLDPDTFANLKAEMTWAMKQWLKAGTLHDKDDWTAIPHIRTRTANDRKLAVEPKETLRSRLGHSPDIVDSLVLTFYPIKKVSVEWI